jgi:hypothetical protein
MDSSARATASVDSTLMLLARIFAPLLGFIGEELAKLGGRHRRRHSAKSANRACMVPLRLLRRRLLGLAQTAPYLRETHCLNRFE